LGIVAIEGASADVAEEHPTLIDLATVVLALGDGRRARGPIMKDELGAAYTLAYFKDIGAREIEKARRHGRRVAVCSVIGAGERERFDAVDVIRQVVRDTDVVAVSAPNEYFMLLPETGALGAHACRRRLVIRAEGDRRARPPGAATDRRGAVPSRREPLAIGVASYPHDGASLDRLMRLARNRAAAQANSAVLALGLAALSLADAVDVLLAKPILDAVPCSPAPLDLALPALLSLVTQACRDARRGGAATVFVTVQTGMGIASAVRHAMHDANDVHVRAVDARGEPGCADLDAIVVLAEHGSWVCCGRFTHERFRGVHAADPLLADLVAHRIALAGGQRGP